MFTIAVVNQKGGSGKSTLAQCLAVAAYLDDKGVAILDMDPQGSAYKWAQRRKEKDPNPVVKSVTPASCVFHGFLPSSPRECCHPLYGMTATLGA
jgi:chromosome partitioning protein